MVRDLLWNTVTQERPKADARRGTMRKTIQEANNCHKQKVTPGKCEDGGVLKVTVATTPPKPRSIPDQIDSKHRTNSLAEEVCAYPDRNTIYLSFYNSTQDVYHSIKIMRHIKKQIKTWRDKAVVRTRLQDELYIKTIR